MFRLTPMLSLPFVLLAGCASDGAIIASGARADRDRAAWAAPPIERSVAVYDGRTGAPVSFDDMLDALARADAVFLGETHTDETTHRVEYAVYDGLLRRRDGRVVLAMEMFERDVQPVLDAYLAGEIDEPALLAQARPWTQYRTAYRPLIERARDGGYPVVASNIPRPLARRIGSEGLAVLDAMSADERREAPEEIHANRAGYWARVDNAVRGHLAMMRSAGDDGDDRRLTSTQTLWDNTMGESCALALDAHPGSSVLHVNGGFHSAYWDGTVYQFRLRQPDARSLTVDIRPARSPYSVTFGSGAPRADFVVVAEARATDLNDGAWTVAYDRTLDYKLELPHAATDSGRVPLMIWLGEDGLGAADGLDLWRDRLGDEAAILSIEPPYRAVFDDLSTGGRWFWSDRFLEDIGSLTSSIERAWAYVMRHYPIDPGRVCIVGEGAGATVAASAGLLADRLDGTVLAFAPRQYARIKDFPLPLEFSSSSRAVSMRILGSADDAAWWSGELEEYRGIGIDGGFETIDAAALDAEEESAVRTALGLPARDMTRGAAPETVDSARARHWARLYALRHAGGDARVTPSAVADDLPRCPGPFGGTTVLVVPDDVDAADRTAWLALEDDDPINRVSRFHRLRVTTPGELAAQLAELDEAGRRNVLIVPATFCADAATMRALERETREIADRLTIQWQPGLGGDLP